MSNLTPASTLADWVTRNPHAAPILEAHHLDYCCGGRRSLVDACAERGLSFEAVINDINAAAPPADGSASVPTDWSQHSLTELCQHIEQSHHAYLRKQLPRLEQLLAKVVAAHGTRHPELASLSANFHALVAELGPHLLKEEQILFPAIRQLESHANTPHFPFGSVQNPIRVMEHEHDTAGHLLQELKHITNGYTPPPDACETWRLLLRGLQELEQDLHQHIHKENNLLFPAAARLESQLV